MLTLKNKTNELQKPLKHVQKRKQISSAVFIYSPNLLNGERNQDLTFMKIENQILFLLLNNNFIRLNIMIALPWTQFIYNLSVDQLV